MSIDDQWRVRRCPDCGGHGQRGLVGLPDECAACGGSGRVFIRPGGHLFAYPGGPACGMMDADAYERAQPLEAPTDA